MIRNSSTRSLRHGGRIAFCMLLPVIVLFAGCSENSSSTTTPAGTRPSTKDAALDQTHPTSDGTEPAAPRRNNNVTHAKLVEVTEGSGLEFTYVNGEEAGNFSILESLGGGGALFDFDRDGWLDVMLAGGGTFAADQQIHGAESGLFRCVGAWRFAPVQKQAGVAEAPFYSHGVAAADYDNDGFQDVLITGYGGLLLFHNCGDGTFEEIASASALTDSAWSSSAAWGDVNADGNLDLYVTHYVNWSFANHPDCRAGKHREVCPPRQFDPLPDTFYRSNGDGTFSDATAEVGLQPDGKGLGVVMADLNQDGAVDVYVGNDTVPNFLYLNDGTGRLSNQALISGTALSGEGVAEGSMGVDVGDYNGDGLPDIWVANYENESFGLYRNNGRGFFQHVSRPAGVTAMGGLFVGWGTAFVDVDRDGDQDLIAANGHVIRHPMNAPLRQQPVLLENLGGKRFLNVTDAAGDGGYLNRPHMGRGLAIGDIDRDGDGDVLITHTNEPAALLSNESRNDHNWLAVRLVGTVSNRDAVGASIRITTSEGARQHDQVKGGGSYASTSDPVRLFGLASATVDELAVRWPSGASVLLESPDVNQALTLIEPREAYEE